MTKDDLPSQLINTPATSRSIVQLFAVSIKPFSCHSPLFVFHCDKKKKNLFFFILDIGFKPRHISGTAYMHSKTPPDSLDGNRAIRKSKSTSNLSMINKKKAPNIKLEVDVDEANKPASPTGKTSPNHRRRAKRSSINNNSLLSTVTSVHELMSFIIHKDDPPAWLKQTDLFKEYANKSQQLMTDHTNPEESPQHYPQQSHRKQRCNLQMYARTGQSWQSLPSPPLKSPSIDQRSKARNHSNESLQKLNLSPIHSSTMDFSTPLNISINQDPMAENALLSNKSKTSKQQTRRQQMVCKKKVPQNGVQRRQQRMNSVENLEPLEKKDSSASSSQNDSNTSTSSSIEHASPSPTTTVSGSSSLHSSPAEYMRGNARLSSPLRIQTSLSPQRRSTRIWAPSSFYINPMWIIPTTTTTSTSSTPKRLLVQTPSTPPSESNKRPRRQCRS